MHISSNWLQYHHLHVISLYVLTFILFYFILLHCICICVEMHSAISLLNDWLWLIDSHLPALRCFFIPNLCILSEHAELIIIIMIVIIIIRMRMCTVLSSWQSTSRVQHLIHMMNVEWRRAQDCISLWFLRETCDCPRWDSNLGPLTPQSGMLPLDHCDLLVTVLPCLPQTVASVDLRCAGWKFSMNIWVTLWTL